MYELGTLSKITKSSGGTTYLWLLLFRKERYRSGEGILYLREIQLLLLKEMLLLVSLRSRRKF